MKYTSALITFFFINFSAYSEETKLDTGYGFQITVPDTHIYNGHADSETILESRKMDGQNINYLTELDKRADAIYVVNIEHLGLNYPDEIVIKHVEHEYIPFFNDTYCKNFQEYISVQYEKTAQQYACELVDFPPIKVGEVLYTVHDGFYSAEERNIQIQFNFDKDSLIAFGLNCMIETCQESEKVMFKLINSMEIIK